jgi:glucosamine-6-phosphate deaminase
MEVITKSDEAVCGVTVADVFDRAVRSGATTLGWRRDRRRCRCTGS